MGKLSRQDFLTGVAKATANFPREKVDLPELGLTDVWIRSSSGRERDEFEESLRIKKGRNKGDTDLSNFRAKLAVRCIEDEDKVRILTDDDALILGEMPVGPLNKIMAVINRVSGTTEEEADKLGNDSASGAASAEPS